MTDMFKSRANGETALMLDGVESLVMTTASVAQIGEQLSKKVKEWD